MKIVQLLPLLLCVYLLSVSNTQALEYTSTSYATSSCDGIPEWNSTTTYGTNGTKVTYNGILYRNKWWTKGENPETQWGPWEALGECDANLSPTVSFTAPENNASYILEETGAITISIVASDDDGTVENTTIEVDGNSFTSTTANWTPTSAGNFTITATATDDKGATSSSSRSITITSNEPIPPTVQVTSPSNNEVIQQTSLQVVNIITTSSDTDGTIESILIEVDGKSFTSTTANWTPSAFGTFEITVTVMDNDGLTATTTSSVTIEEKVDSGCSSPEYGPYPNVYNSTDVVVHNGDLYEAQVDNLYNVIPGEADHFWKALGPCVDTNTAPSISTVNTTVIGLIPQTLTATIIDAEGDNITASFSVDGNTLEAVGVNDIYTTSWTPSTYGTYTVSIQAVDDKGKVNSSDYLLTVEEPTGPQNPVITSFTPANGTTIKQASLSAVEIVVNASDIDGTVVSTLIEVGGVSFSSNTANWTPTSFGNYTITATVTDNEGLETSATSSISIIENLAFTDKVLVGYWHNWNLSSCPYIRLKDVDDRYNVVCIAFAEPKIRDVDNTMIFDPVDIYNFQNEPTDKSRQEFKDDVALLQSQGKKVILSLGGANGVVHLDNDEEQQKFVNSMITLCETYGFDGVDIDLEGSSLTLNAGDTDFTNPTTPRILNFIQGMKEIKAHFGPSFLLTSAPETAYVQGGQTAYGGAWGGYLPILHSLREQLDYVHVQLYNTGSLGALDGKAYTQGSADFIVAMTEMLLQGFETKSTAGFFPAFRENQVALGLPANRPAAPAGGYTTPTEVQKALNYLVNGIPFGGVYTLINSNGYPDLRGMMTWSINWDKTTAYEYAESYDTFFNGSNARLIGIDLEEELKSEIGQVYPNPFENSFNISISLKVDEDVDAYIYNTNGTLIGKHHNTALINGQQKFTVPTQQLTSGIYLIKVHTNSEQKVFRVIKK
ncbi:T9SS type A sorting domain-containing protein [Flammeovirga pectinis]|uniref:chitinase n=1 Tax=Flammeovirga pectinis TaxID=2494373 RepID=A0A3Q9FMA6_9BACT|nr:glycosyl hydrolase family 18 protein [Flammeovirga pectinis]AZQ61498.1 T9SS type A sorting domain-containing protein [Flammeovirga pectinis]